MSSFSIGSKVRVLGKEERNGQQKLATISLVDDSSYGIIYDDDCEEVAVSPSRLSALLPWEHLPLHRYDALELKEFGNALFRIKDYDAAVRYYKASLDVLLRTVKLSVGTTVLVAKSPSEYVSGMIADANASGSYEVIFDEEELDDESNVPASRLIVVATNRRESSNHRDDSKEQSELDRTDVVELQRALYMNLARCSFQKQPPLPGWAVRWSTLALAVTLYKQQQSNAGSSNDRTTEKGDNEAPSSNAPKQLADALYLRCKAFIAASRPQFARKDAQVLTQLDSSKADALMKEIDAFCLRRQKSNRKLAKDVASWVETAMKMSSDRRQDMKLVDVDIDVADDDD